MHTPRAPLAAGLFLQLMYTNVRSLRPVCEKVFFGGFVPHFSCRLSSSGRCTCTLWTCCFTFPCLLCYAPGTHFGVDYASYTYNKAYVHISRGHTGGDK